MQLSFPPRVCNSRLSLGAVPASTRDCLICGEHMRVRVIEYGCRPDFYNSPSGSAKFRSGIYLAIKKQVCGPQVIIDFFVVRFALVATFVTGHSYTPFHKVLVPEHMWLFI